MPPSDSSSTLAPSPSPEALIYCGLERSCAAYRSLARSLEAPALRQTPCWAVYVRSFTDMGAVGLRTSGRLRYVQRAAAAGHRYSGHHYSSFFFDSDVDSEARQIF